VDSVVLPLAISGRFYNASLATQIGELLGFVFARAMAFSVLPMGLLVVGVVYGYVPAGMVKAKHS
jgi:hypothetical protein